MATSTATVVCDNSTLANYKSWAQTISNFFTTAGWTQTADTGQVVWGSATVPAGAYNYEVWKDADSFIFIKMEYGFDANNIRIRVTVGTGSNGTGTITGSIGFNALIITNAGGSIANQGGTTFQCNLSGNSRNFRFLMWIGNATNSLPTFFCIERAKDATGADVTSSGYATCLFASGTNGGTRARQQTIMQTGGLVTTAETSFVSTCLTTNSGTGSFNGTVAAFPVFPAIGYPGNPMLGAMICVGADVADAATVTVNSMYGGTHTYVSCKSGGGFIFSLLGKMSENGAATALLMQYE